MRTEYHNGGLDSRLGSFSECCQQTDESQDWYEWESVQPSDLTRLVAYANLPAPISIRGQRVRLTGFARQQWAASPILIGAPVCSANGIDNGQMAADAAQWNFDHLTQNSAANLPDSLKRVLFLRGGLEWTMKIQLLIGGPAPLDYLAMGFRDNAGTRGDQTGAYPVIQFDATAGTGLTGSLLLELSLRPLYGTVNVVFWSQSQSYGSPPQIDYAMTEMEWRVVE